MIEEPSDEFCRAYSALWHAESNSDHKPDRNAVEATLKRFSDGSTDSEDLCFMRELARCVLAAGGKGTEQKRRENRVLSAAGLSGTYDNNRDFVACATQLYGFDGVTIASGIRRAKYLGLLSDSVDEPTARKMIARSNL